MPDESFEQTLDKRLTQLVENKLRSIKTRLGILTGRVQSLELMDFQNQLDRLNERITKLSDEFIEFRRTLYTLQITLFFEHVQGMMHETSHILPKLPDWAQAQRDCKGEIDIYYAKALEGIRHYKDNKDMHKAFMDFWDKVNEFLKAYSFPQVDKF